MTDKFLFDEEDQRRGPPLLWLVLISLLLHWLWAETGLIPWLTRMFPKEPPKERVVEIEPFQQNRRRQVVVTEKNKKEVPDDKKPAPFAGEFKNRVEKQTQAAQTGNFREQRLSQSRTKPEPKFDRTDRDAGRTSPQIRDLLPPQTAASPYRVKEIDQGATTHLNTDSMRYASFFNRIARAIYDPWIANVRESVQGLAQRGRIDRGIFSTRLSVILDRDGAIRSVTVKQSSGFRELDQAAISAFWDNQPFRNPPAAVYEGKPEIELPMEFSVHLGTGGFGIGAF